MMKRKISGLLAAVMAVTSVAVYSPVYADVVSDARTAKKNAEDALEELDGRMDDIRERQENLKKEMEEMDGELVRLIYDIDILEDEVSEKKKEIKATQKELDSAEETEQELLDAMKLRIKYMYENNDGSVPSSILEGRNTAPELNKTTLFNDMYDYDREQLEKYEKAVERVKEIAERLELEKEELEEKQASLVEQKDGLQQIMEDKKTESGLCADELADAEDMAERYRKIIDEQNEVIQKQISVLYRSADVGAYDAGYVVPGNGTGTDVANYAMQFLGNPYVYGGTSLTRGIDCSGFTQAVYEKFGYSLPRSSSAQRTSGREVSVSELLPGDLVCYSGHVAIYIGNGKIIHASNSKSGIKISNNMGYRNIITFRRIID